ncbi:MAG: helix-turn-helix domain-containing protein [Pseudomonadales bacterium]|nr:helix-turn-helix domain-containing protein [Pseudomonadales bacterium]
MTSQIDIIVGANIRKTRKKAGVTQAGLARHLSITSQQVQKYETGVNRVSAGRLLEIANVFGYSTVLPLYDGVNNVQLCDAVVMDLAKHMIRWRT